MAWQQVYDPMGSMVLSTLLAAIPVVVMLVGLGFLHMKAHVAAAAGLIAALIVLNGLFAMSEMALSASRRVRLLALAEAGDVRAQAALRLMDRPTQFLSSIQIGITSIGVFNGIVGEAAFSQALSGQLTLWGLSPHWADVSPLVCVPVGVCPHWGPDTATTASGWPRRLATARRAIGQVPLRKSIGSHFEDSSHQ